MKNIRASRLQYVDIEFFGSQIREEEQAKSLLITASKQSRSTNPFAIFPHQKIQVLIEEDNSNFYLQLLSS